MLFAATAVARGDVVGGANVRATFDGWIEPRALPRDHAKPISLHVRGRLRTTDGRLPPQLRRVEISINRHGKVSTAGLPTCRRGALVASTSRDALRRCRGALVGSGRFTAHIEVPEQAPFPSVGRMLAFLGREDGRRVIYAHIYGVDPVPTSQLLTFRFKRPEGGAFGTRMVVELPKVGEDWGHVTGFRLDLHRRYSFRGHERSVINARCPAPAGARSALFTAARGTYYLADGRRLSRIVVSRCLVER